MESKQKSLSLEEYEKLFQNEPSVKENYTEEDYHKLFQDPQFCKSLEEQICNISIKNIEQVCSIKIYRNHSHIPFSPNNFESGAKINFVGSFVGTFCLLARPKQLLQTILLSMLGVESEQAYLEQDALGELANILCGNILPFISNGIQSHLKMTSPMPLTTEEMFSIQKRYCLANLHFSLENGELDLYIFIKNILLA